MNSDTRLEVAGHIFRPWENLILLFRFTDDTQFETLFTEQNTPFLCFLPDIESKVYFIGVPVGFEGGRRGSAFWHIKEGNTRKLRAATLAEQRKKIE